MSKTEQDSLSKELKDCEIELSALYSELAELRSQGQLGYADLPIRQKIDVLEDRKQRLNYKIHGDTQARNVSCTPNCNSYYKDGKNDDKTQQESNIGIESPATKTDYLLQITQLLLKDPKILFKKKRLRGLFSDLFCNDILKTNLCMRVYETGFIDVAMSNFPIKDSLRTQYITKLTIEQGTEQRLAAKAVDAWISILTQELVDALNEYSTENNCKYSSSVLAVELDDYADLPAISPALKRDDMLTCYINPALPKETSKSIYIPCGVGKTDLGFFIHGITKENMCKHPRGTIYALVYNYLVRNTVIDAAMCHEYLKHCDKNVSVAEFKDIFRFAMIVLQLIRHNKKLVLNVPDENKANLLLAVKLIDYYAEFFCGLAKQQYIPLRIDINKSQGISLSLYRTKKDSAAVYITNNTASKSVAREIWYGSKIQYRLDNTSIKPLETLLREISPYKAFRKGQFEALKDMLSGDDNSVCIMPTGSGKSLIFYMASLLQPLPVFVVSPTEILIDDQIRNLSSTHKIDNVAHLLLTDNNNFSKYCITNNINYLTPVTLQNEYLKIAFRHINNGTRDAAEIPIAPGACAAYIILDEVHCISSLGHDFRPEYLMLANLLQTFLGNVTMWGFTATANYSVVKDIQNQLHVEDKNFISPVSFEKLNIKYDYRGFNSEGEIINAIAELAKNLAVHGEKSIVFAKDQAVCYKIRDAIGDDVTVFSSHDLTAYYNFVNGTVKILIANEEMGIGINLPEVDNIIHFGLPFSKSDYVQQIGRAGRSGGAIKSYVMYLRAEGNIPEELLSRNTDIADIADLLKGVNNDYTHIFKHLTNSCNRPKDLSNKLNELCNELDYRDQSVYVAKFKSYSAAEKKRLLYMLHVVGYINDWAIYKSEGDLLTFRVDINSSAIGTFAETQMLQRMKQKTRDFFSEVAQNSQSKGIAQKEISEIGKAEDLTDIIDVYVTWYYEKYLYQHNEQFLELYDFITGCVNKDSADISAEIKSYFTLPFAKIKQDESYFAEVSLVDGFEIVKSGVNYATFANVNRINADDYSVRLDWMLFCYELIHNGHFNAGRFERLFAHATHIEKKEILALFNRLYVAGETTARLETMNYLSGQNVMGLHYIEFIDTIYSTESKDIVYYGVLAEYLNRHLSQMEDK